MSVLPLGTTMSGPDSLNGTSRRSDHRCMEESTPWKRTIVYHGSSEALGPGTDVMLSRLGYRMMRPETFAELASDDPSFEPDLLVVDDRRLDELYAQASGEEPDATGGARIVLLTGGGRAADDDPRVVGAVRRPAGLHDLYRLMQQIFEDTPRTTPRIATQLSARCARGERNWEGRVLSLSENGCLIRSTEAIGLGQRILLEFSIPNRGPIRLDAEAAYQLMPDTGLVFNAVAPDQRKSIERFVSDTLAS